jgi:hypothetical protein
VKNDSQENGNTKPSATFNFPNHKRSFSCCDRLIFEDAKNPDRGPPCVKAPGSLKLFCRTHGIAEIGQRDRVNNQK